MRAITAVVLVWILAAIACVQQPRPDQSLPCPQSGMFSATLGMVQPLHDRSNAVVVHNASIMPNVALATWTNPADFESSPHGSLAATICATEAYPKLNLSGGAPGNELWLRHTGKGDGAADWQAFVRTVGTDKYYELVVYRRDTADDATKHPRGHAQWIDGDENIWVSCAKGCCYVSGGGGDTT